MSEVHRLKVFKNRVPMKIFGHERHDITGDQRKLGNEELHDFTHTKYYLDFQVKEGEKDGACGMYGGEEKCIQGFYDKLKE